MADDNDSSQGDQGDKAGQNTGGGGDADGKNTSEGGAEKFVTPEVLTGSLNAQKRWLREDIQKASDGVKTELLAAIKKLGLSDSTDPGGTGHVPDSDKGKGKEGKATDPELVKLRREVDALKTSNSSMSASLEEASKREKTQKFESEIKEALVRHKCNKVEAAYRVISPDLEQDEETQRVFATVQGEHGTEELTADEYVTRVARETACPEFFKGTQTTNGGSPAGGDSGTGSKSHLFTAEQIADPEFYLGNRDKIRDAIDKGLVKGLDVASPVN